MKIKIGIILVLFMTSFTAPLAEASFWENFEMTFGEYTLTDYIEEWTESQNPSDEDEMADDTYTVMEGDNLYRIALNHAIPLFALKEWNELTEDLIHPGDVLIINGEEGKEALSTPSTEPVASTSVPETEKSAPSPKAAVPPAKANGKELTVTATAYTAYCKGCSGTTAYGIDLRANPNQKVIAVDPRVIPLGTKVWVEGYGEALAADTGGAIKGNKIDVFIPSHSNAMEWGVKTVKLRVLN
ncbi:peptidoglycan-binding protein [Bacillus sp. OxB-1]|uniref:3D domain-containing protein n=1 Tax=Bacillus sp. (strain OxB-1) TaxID=98228 RepID=UPI0005822810|nr:3D domain-containing protein [Bacillus sp. OxB-1]BAQ08761.1 peptidoglycan-binding protein [Bacillus sp. OxB-1]